MEKEEADEAEELAELKDVVERLLAQSQTEPEIRRLPLEQIEPVFGDCPSFQRLKKVIYSKSNRFDQFIET